MRIVRVIGAYLTITSAAACTTTPLPEAPLAPGTIAFGVFGDGPYYPWENARYTRLLAAVEQARPSWLLHVGDLFWRPCSDGMLSTRRREFDAMTTPVVYVPGDNEWTDCHTKQTGAFDTLERLAHVRRTLLPEATHALGRTPMTFASQADQPAWREFVEHRRWSRGRIVFATLHLVGSDNGLEPFPARRPAHDAEVEHRTQAAIAWLGDTFDRAAAQEAGTVVLVWHGNPGFSTPSGARRGYEAVLDTLRARALRFDGEVLVIHGDSHQQHVDHPLRSASGATIANVTRLETFGSPEIGWVRVVVDTVRGTVVAIEPRLIAKRALVF